MACSLGPLYFSSWRLGIDPMVSASDASESGGAVCASLGMTALGARTAVVAGGLTYSRTEDVLGVVLLGDLLGSTLKALENLRCPWAWCAAGNLSSESIRVISRTWPETKIMRDETPEGSAGLMIRSLRLKGSRVEKVICVAALRRGSASWVAELLREAALDTFDHLVGDFGS